MVNSGMCVSFALLGPLWEPQPWKEVWGQDEGGTSIAWVRLFYFTFPIPYSIVLYSALPLSTLLFTCVVQSLLTLNIPMDINAVQGTEPFETSQLDSLTHIHTLQGKLLMLALISFSLYLMNVLVILVVCWGVFKIKKVGDPSGASTSTTQQRHHQSAEEASHDSTQVTFRDPEILSDDKKGLHDSVSHGEWRPLPSLTVQQVMRNSEQNQASAINWQHPLFCHCLMI